MAQAGLRLGMLTEEELLASIAHTLQDRPAASDIWIFAYGSLIWNPVFHFVDRQIGKIYGWHRQFCLWTPIGRGTPENPGLVLGLDRGGSCQGIVYRIEAAALSTELLLIWRREMIVGSYVPRWVRVFSGKASIEAITFTINPHHPGYARKLPPALIAHQIATASGRLGTCADYLHQTIEGLAQENIQDRSLLALCDRVRAVQQSPIPAIHPDLHQHYPLFFRQPVSPPEPYAEPTQLEPRAEAIPLSTENTTE